MHNSLDSLYVQFEARWELQNPKPSPPMSDTLLLVLQIAVAGGAILLSGSRTGNAVASIGSLQQFGNKLSSLIGLGSQLAALFLAAEAVLGFVTFDAAIFLSGYLTGDRKAAPVWYWVLLGIAIVPAVFANMLPGVMLIGPKAGSIFTGIVDVLIGLCTPIMAFVSGRVIGVTRTRRLNLIEDELGLWADKKANAWRNSHEYRNWMSLNVKTPQKKREPTNGRADIVAYLQKRGSGTEVRIDELAEALGMSKGALSRDILRLVKDDEVERNGNVVWVSDY